MASTVVALGLTIAAAGFAGCYVLQAIKHMEPQVKQVFQSLPKSAFRGGRACLRPIAGKGTGMSFVICAIEDGSRELCGRKSQNHLSQRWDASEQKS
uniref:Mitochondrial import inner membrane translocase subunit TIM14 n=1 Tax=Microcebus murinus TaxID=30608 RepID=A0A8C5Y9V8_MICMU